MSSEPPHVSALMEVLRQHWVFTLATNAPARTESDAHECAVPYPTPLFYALHEYEARLDASGDLGAAPSLLFLTDPGTTHGGHLGRGPTGVAAAVYLETEEPGRIQGAQLRGTIRRGDALSEDAREQLFEAYFGRHPGARPMLAGRPQTQIYELRIEWAKLTDNALGMGVHPEWRFSRD